MAAIYETPRTRVRRLTSADYEAFLAITGDPDVARWEYSEPATPEQARNLLDELLNLPDTVELEWVDYGIVTPDTDSLIGLVSHSFDPVQRQAEIGYRIARAFWGQGYGTESVRGLLAHCFGRGAHRVFAIVEPRNLASVRVLEKVGMRREAYLIENCWVKGEWQSEYIYAMLEREYRP